MFDEDLLEEEEIKKKKRRVLVVLFALLLLGTAVALPLAELSPPSATPVSEAGTGTPARAATVAGQTVVPAGTPGVEATATVPSEGTPHRTATAAGAGATPAVTEGTPGGVGGGTPELPLAATATPTGTSVTLATPTLAGTAAATPAPGVEATTTRPPEATPQAAATATIAGTPPAVTEGTPGGVGDGTPAGPLQATGTPADTSRTLATPTLAEPGQLPASGADAGRELGGLLLGLVAVLLGTLMLGVGCALRNTEPGPG